MDSNTLKKIKKELEGVKPFEENELPDELRTWDDFDRTLATMIQKSEDID